MGGKINTATYEYCPNLSPDGKYFLFSSEMDVKWISAEVLQRLQVKQKAATLPLIFSNIPEQYNKRKTFIIYPV